MIVVTFFKVKLFFLFLIMVLNCGLLEGKSEGTVNPN